MGDHGYRLGVGLVLVACGKLEWIETGNQALLLTGLGAGIVLIAIIDIGESIREWIHLKMDQREEKRNTS